MATLHRLKTRDDRFREDQGRLVRQMVLDLPDLPERAVGEVVAAIDRATATKNGWTFMMMGPAQNAAVVDWILSNSIRPLKAVKLWALCFTKVRTDTQEIMLTRDDFAVSVGIEPREVSRIMSELVSVGAIIRRREKVAGMRGPGVARYFMNPWVGTHLPGAVRDAAQEQAPPLLSLLKPMQGEKV
jgi:CRP-like cAMP-binding protein